MKISDLRRLHTLACKSDNWRLVGNITLEIFRFHTLACKSDNWRSIEHITHENLRFHTFACRVLIGSQ